MFIFSCTLLFSSAHAATAFFANGGLTENGIEWCEENQSLYEFMGNGFFEHHKHSIESRICASLYNDPLWTYSEYDRYKKLVEQSRVYAELEIRESIDEASSGIVDTKPAIVAEIPQEITQQQKELKEKTSQTKELVCGEGTIEKDNQCIPESNTVNTQAEKVIDDKEGGGCLIATAAYGSELAPQVQQLREIRDSKILKTESGTLFIENFNKIYYLFSPTIADYERENQVFREVLKTALIPMISSLSILNHVEISSESEMLAYGTGLILLNAGMYLGIPICIMLRIKNLRESVQRSIVDIFRIRSIQKTGRAKQSLCRIGNQRKH